MTIRRHFGLLFAGLFATLAACADQNPVAQHQSEPEAQDLAPLYLAPENGVEGSYIVVLEDGSIEDGAAPAFSRSTSPGAGKARAFAQSVATAVAAEPRVVFDAAINGFAARLDDDQLRALRRNPDVAYIEQDQLVELTGSSGVMIVSRMDATKCATVVNGSSSNGTRIVLSRCEGAANQIFERTSSGELQIFGSKCLDATGGEGDDGDLIIIWSCHGGTNQKWSRTSAGEFRGINGTCLDAKAAQTANGTPLIIWSCHGGTNQKWELREAAQTSTPPTDSGSGSANTQSMNSSGDPWGLDRIDQQPLPLSKSYRYNRTGKGVHVYVIDSGIQTSHPEFEGRARNVLDTRGGSGWDCNGHGTSVASIIGGKTYGVAKDAKLYGLRVQGCDGWGYLVDWIIAMEWVRKHHKDPAVVNISLTAGYSRIMNDYVNKLAASGVFVAVSAGNNSRDACDYSPASASGAFAVAASTKTDDRASYSNYGSCVDLYAPGSGIRSADRGGESTRWTGTSMASPHVAGVAALLKQRYPGASSKDLSDWLISNSLRGRIDGNRSDTPNRLLFKDWL